MGVAHKGMCAGRFRKTAVTLNSSGPSFRVYRKVETLVSSAMIDIHVVIAKPNHRDIFFSIHVYLNRLPIYTCICTITCSTCVYVKYMYSVYT